MKRLVLFAGTAVLTLLPLRAQENFAGTWIFNAAKSQNIGMMSQMRLTAVLKQDERVLVITNNTVFNGDQGSSEIRLDLTGKPVPNKTPMEALADTVTKWNGNRLVTTWTSPGSVAGSTSVRTETRYLSDAGKVMTVESGYSRRPSMVMVYDRQ